MAAALALVLGLNALVYGLGWNDDAGAEPSYAPPGVAVGAIWVLLFALMGIARWLVVREPGPEGAGAGRWVSGLVAACALFPLYALSTGSEEAALLGTLATAGLAVLALGRVAEVSRRAAELVLVVLLWLAYATAVAVGSLLV